MKRVWKKFLTLVTCVCLTVAFTVPASAAAKSVPKDTEPVGIPHEYVDNIHLGWQTAYKFKQKKTLDLTYADTKVTLSKAKKEELKKKARAEVKKNMELVRDFFIEKGVMSEKMGRGEGSADQTFWDELDVFVEEKAGNDAEKKNEMNQAGLFFNDLVANCDSDGYMNRNYNSGTTWTQPYRDAYSEDGAQAEWDAYLNQNAAERFNRMQSKELAKQIREKLPLTVNYDLVPLKSDGSEDSKYGIGKRSVGDVKISRGELKGDKTRSHFSQVDFSAGGQFYDEIADYFMTNLLGEYGEDLDEHRIINPCIPNATYGRRLLMKGWSAYVEVKPNTPISLSNLYIKMGKKFGLSNNLALLQGFPEQHILNSDKGRQTSSNDTLVSFNNYFIDDKEDSDGAWPGWHCLLEVCDSLGTYPVLEPGIVYSQMYDLMRYDQTVTYSFDMGEDVDFVTDVKTDSKGKVTSLSKPLYTEKERRSLCEKIKAKTEEEGIYRFKLVESSTTVGDLGSDEFTGSKEVKVCDIVADKSGDEVEVRQIFVYDSVKDADAMVKYYKENKGCYGSGLAEMTSHAAFKSRVMNPDNCVPGKVTLKKVKKGKKKITVTWKRVAKKTTGYQVRVFKKNGKIAKTVTAKQSSKATISKVVKKLKKGKYTVKVRAYNKVDGKAYYGAWSKAKSVKVKK